MNILLLAKRDDWGSLAAAELVRSRFRSTTVEFLSRGEPLPESAHDWQGDYLISYLSPVVLSAPVLGAACRAAINFHPGPPEYPGIGCTNFAIYYGATEYGVTCHHMAATVDSGKIVATKRFPVYPRDTVQTLTQRSYAHMHLLFAEIFALIAVGSELPSSDEHWTRKPYTRAQLNELGRVDAGMSCHEVERRVRAMEFPGAPGAFLELCGRRFWHLPK